ncbi:MAG: thiamine-phosphate pyrophosphorylase [Candidatus Omnitrophica bacterium]|nr:thiamine-phosphate pyrophosphorylase [Candidatus Omnitrophota bacterium]
MPINPSSTKRIIDANINRAKEGLRVCEEILRFMLNNKQLTRTIKDIRHKIDAAVKKLHLSAGELLKERAIDKDVGRSVTGKELHRRHIIDIFTANIQRTKESLRVLEEFSKLQNVRAAREFKQIRYQTYALEKKAIERITALFDTR